MECAELVINCDITPWILQLPGFPTQNYSKNGGVILGFPASHMLATAHMLLLIVQLSIYKLDFVASEQLQRYSDFERLVVTPVK